MKTQLNMFGLNIVDNLKRNVLIVSETSVTNKDQTYLLKLNTSEQEVRLLRDCFPKINQRDFGVLQLPVAHRVGSLFNNKDWWVIMDYFKGESINWDERNPECIGGKNISLDYINVLTGILADLKSIDIGLFSGVLPSVESAPWYTSLKNKLTKLISCQLFPPSYRQKAINMIEFGLSGESKKDLILTNGDFQFRNFIKLTNGKIAVIDWTETLIILPI